MKTNEEIQNKLADIRAKLHAQNLLLQEAKDALEAANQRLKKTREEVKKEFKQNL